MQRDLRKLRARLRFAFKDLRARGYVALEEPACCKNCGWKKVEQMAASLLESGKRESFAGGVFYHEQDTDRMRETGRCYIAYGPICLDDEYSGTTEADLEEATKAAGRDVVQALHGRRIAVEWDGSPQTRILAKIPNSTADEDEKREQAIWARSFLARALPAVAPRGRRPHRPPSPGLPPGLIGQLTDDQVRVIAFTRAHPLWRGRWAAEYNARIDPSKAAFWALTDITFRKTLDQLGLSAESFQESASERRARRKLEAMRAKYWREQADGDPDIEGEEWKDDRTEGVRPTYPPPRRPRAS